MITIQIGKGVRYKNLPTEAKEKIQNDLTLKNPKYEEAVKHGRYINVGLNSHLHFFSIFEDSQEYWTPRGYMWYMQKWLKVNGHEVKIEDRTLLLPLIDVEFQGTLRDYQQEATDAVTSLYPQGMLEAATGAGKTVIGCGVIAERKQPTLIIVHSKELLYQWQGALKKFLDYDCGLIGGGKFEVAPISVGIINTVKKRAPELVNKFGHIIIDECHKAPASTWTETLIQFPARYILGLSATPFRRDGLDLSLNAYIGHKLHKVNKQRLHDIGAVLKPQIYLIKTNFNYVFEGSYSRMISDLCNDTSRNKLIADCVAMDFEKNKQNILIVSDRKNHCLEIQKLLKIDNLNSEVLTGSTASKERIQIVKSIKDGKCNILIATISLIGEGFDAPELCSLFLTTPIKFSGRLLQVVGRILRPKEGKIPKVYDFRDDNVGILRNQGMQRGKVYQKEWGTK